MQLKNVVSFATLAAFVAGLSIGCDGSDVKIAKAPAPPPPPVGPGSLPKDPKKGGGSKSSSGNLKRNPGADPLAPQ